MCPASTVVEFLTRVPKIEGSNAASGTGEFKWQKTVDDLQGDQIGRCCTNQATFCRLVKEIAQKWQYLGYKFITFSPK